MPIIIYDLHRCVTCKVPAAGTSFLVDYKQTKKEINQIISVTHHFIDISANVRVHFVAEYILPLDTFNLYSLSNLPC